jgi:hypothetical protein
MPQPGEGGSPQTRSDATLTPTEAEKGVFPLDPLLGLLRGRGRGRGQLIELSGGISSGRTALAYRLALGATLRGELVGWVDLPNALDPRYLRRAGVRLSSLLWVRPRDVRAALRAAELLLKAGFAVVTIDLEGAPPRSLFRLGTAAWTRLQRAVRGNRSTAILLGSNRAAGATATLGLHLDRYRSRFDGGLFEGFESEASILRSRTGDARIASEHPFFIRHRPDAGARTGHAGDRTGHAGDRGAAPTTTTCSRAC